MDLLIYIIFIAVFAEMAIGVFIVRVVMYRALRQYGVDPYSRGWLYAGSRSWVLKYKEICDEHGLSLRYWKLLRLVTVSSAILGSIWLVLAVVAFLRSIGTAMAH